MSVLLLILSIALFTFGVVTVVSWFNIGWLVHRSRTKVDSNGDYIVVTCDQIMKHFTPDKFVRTNPFPKSIFASANGIRSSGDPKFSKKNSIHASLIKIDGKYCILSRYQYYKFTKWLENSLHEFTLVDTWHEYFNSVYAEAKLLGSGSAEDSIVI